MPTDAVSSEPVGRLLHAGIEELERAARDGSYNTMSIRALGNAAKVLRREGIADRSAKLLRAAPDSMFTAGMLTNIEFPAVVAERMRALDDLEALEQRHPPYREDVVLERIRSCVSSEPHFALCLEGLFREAQLLAGSGSPLEEVGNTLAVFGEFDAARRVASDPALEGFRQQGVKLVLVIELFRRGRVDEARTLLDELESAGLDTWDRVHVALAFAGREPWRGYPFPDW